MASGFFDHVRACFQPIQNGYGCLRKTGNGNKTNRSLWLEVEFQGERWIDHSDLAAGIHNEIEWSGLVDPDGNNN
jgi:hypothetical protein